MIRRAPIATRTNTLFSYTTVCRYVLHVVHLDDGALGRQVAAQADDAAGRREGARAGPHNILVGRQGHALELLLDGLAGHRDAVAVQVAAVEQRPHDDLHAADLEEVLGDVAPAGLQVGDVGRSEEGRVGNECGSTCRYGWSPD